MAKKMKDEELKDTVSEEQQAEQKAADTENDQKQENTQNEQGIEEELKKERDKFLRLFAEFENYKKRTSKERVELFKTAGQDIMVAMLPILDDFDRALTELSKKEEGETLTGVTLISNKLKDTLRSKGLGVLEVNEGDAFDAEIHEAVTQIPAPSDDLKGKVIDVIEKGYKLGDRIIRHPKVVVGK
ncbi:nucleotide exchange factor GrpE [Robertkochia aurantiaca]|uniref:nucleotide exchange factor GrpE n=1 Tax=Robertkochia aurantiaca TaxID=2873700 RepID=UPI001CCF3176|nr:nucleotide exchange factor GrpE [Robertkochia sp. 3YJGBD-33]